jgi:amidase
MSVDRPSRSDLERLSGEFHFGIEAKDWPDYERLVDWALANFDVLEELADEAPAPAPHAPREHWTPSPEDNPYNAWLVQSDFSSGVDGPLLGKTVAVKDNVAVAGLPLRNGSTIFDGYTPDFDAAVVRRVLEAGGTIAGKAVCESLCYSGASHTSDTGPVLNPHDPTRMSGGSSSGSAALLAARAVDLAIGSDQGGSIRGPSAWSGVYGLKPTFGLVPYTGAFPMEMTIDHLGPMANSVEDVALLLSVLAGEDDGNDPRQRGDLRVDDYVGALGQSAAGLRLGILREGFGFENSEPEVDDTVRAAAEQLSAHGLKVSDVSVPWHTRAGAIWCGIAFEGATSIMLFGEGFGNNWKGAYYEQLMTFFAQARRERGPQMPPTMKMQTLAGQWIRERYRGTFYARARGLAVELTRRYDAALADCDVLVMPTLPMRARTVPEPGSVEQWVRRALEMAPNTMPHNITGHPAMNVPCAMVDGLPVGLMLVGRRGEDATVLRVAKAIQDNIFAPSAPAAATA